MLVYIYKAAFYCQSCAQEIKADLSFAQEGISEYDYDSDDYPKGPFSVGESDTPDHCDTCSQFLENALTQDGYDYVTDAIQENTGNQDVLDTWAEFYNLKRED